jgi:hypothetical protein
VQRKRGERKGGRDQSTLGAGDGDQDGQGDEESVHFDCFAWLLVGCSEIDLNEGLQLVAGERARIKLVAGSLSL